MTDDKYLEHVSTEEDGMKLGGVEFGSHLHLRHLRVIIDVRTLEQQILKTLDISREVVRHHRKDEYPVAGKSRRVAQLFDSIRVVFLTLLRLEQNLARLTFLNCLIFLFFLSYFLIFFLILYFKIHIKLRV